MGSGAQNLLKPTTIFCIVLALTIGIIGFVGNCLVVTVIRKKQLLRTTTNILLANVALADIITFVLLPFMLLQRSLSFPEGIFADFLCKFLIDYHVPLTARTASILTLTVISVERYHAIVKPMREGVRLRKNNVRYAIIAVWISSIVISLPLYIFGHYKGYCKHGFPNYSMYAITVASYGVFVLVLPLITIMFCYFQILKELYFKKSVAPQNNALAEDDSLSKRKLMKVSLSVVTANVACLLPLGIFGVLKYFGTISHDALNGTVVLFFLEGSLNPFLYAHQSSNFRQAFKEMLRRQR